MLFMIAMLLESWNVLTSCDFALCLVFPSIFLKFFFESLILNFAQECKSSSVGEFDQCILMHILLLLYLGISLVCFIIFTILLCF